MEGDSQLSYVVLLLTNVLEWRKGPMVTAESDAMGRFVAQLLRITSLGPV